MRRVLTRGFAAGLLALCACVRFGYDELPLPVADGGGSGQSDAAGPPDAAGQSDSATAPDSATEADASAMSDAAIDRDAAAATDGAMPDGAADPDAAMLDGAIEPDASVDTDAAISCSPIPRRDYCVELPALPDPPLLNGVLDCGLELVELPPTSWDSNQSVPSDNHARYAAAWRPDGIYLYVEVDDMLLLPALMTDDGPWCGDGVELYVDSDGLFPSPPDYDDPGTMQFIAASPSLDDVPIALPQLYHTRQPGSPIREWSGGHMMVARDNGYALEAFFTATDLELDSWSLASGESVGLDIAINVSVEDASDNAKCGYALGQYYLRVSDSPCNNQNCRPHTTIEAFCSAVLE